VGRREKPERNRKKGKKEEGHGVETVNGDEQKWDER
jgi:hypothetical protein